MLRTSVWLICFCVLLWGGNPSNAYGANELDRKPFTGSALTPQQLAAWDYYLAEESSQYGCNYGDDPRLSEQPFETLEALANGDDMPPLQVTLRTYLQASESVRTLLQKNMYIASMECNKVYVYGDDLIGHPVLPYEEFLSILLWKLGQESGLRAHVGFLRTTKVAAMDVRWFWGFFLLSADHHRLLGYDSATITGLARAMPGDLGDVTALNSHYLIYRKAFSQGLYVNSSNGCNRVVAEPSEDVIVDKSITWDLVNWLYRSEQIRSSGSWRPVPANSIQGYTLANASLIENPSNPYFNANRRTHITPRECN